MPFIFYWINHNLIKTIEWTHFECLWGYAVCLWWLFCMLKRLRKVILPKEGMCFGDCVHLTGSWEGHTLLKRNVWRLIKILNECVFVCLLVYVVWFIIDQWRSHNPPVISSHCNLTSRWPPVWLKVWTELFKKGKLRLNANIKMQQVIFLCIVRTEK